MLFHKPKDKRYVDMCAEFDEEFYSPNRNDTKLFMYMYLVYYMFACEAGMFKSPDDYDQYAQFAAKTVYIRYLKKEKKGEKIKSLKNYADSTKNHLRVMYLKETYQHVVGDGYDDEEAEGIGNYLRSVVQPSHTEELIADMEDVLSVMPKVMKRIIKESPYRKDNIVCKRLYLSAMLTFISSITLSRDNIIKFKERAKKLEGDKLDAYYCKLIKKERNKDVVLWKLGPDMEPYVEFIVNKARFLLSGDIDETKSRYVMPDDVVDTLVNNLYREVFNDSKVEEY